MYNEKLYQEHLDRVSRSFAKSIATLDEPLRQEVGLSYIICRIIDTIEDDLGLERKTQKQAFRYLARAIEAPSAIPAFKDYISSVSFSNPDEALLIQDAPVFLQDLHHLPVSSYVHIKKLSLRMMRGMWHFLNIATPGAFKIKSIAELNTYCFYVAGLVGECLTALVANKSKEWQVSCTLKKQSHAFGLYLQKINILKDQYLDEKEGRFFVPNRNEVYKTLCAHAYEAYQYILQIPKTQKAYRVFCLSAFLLGLHTLRKLDPDTATLNPKVSKLQMLKLYTFLDDLAESDIKLEKYVLEIQPQIHSYQNDALVTYLEIEEALT